MGITKEQLGSALSTTKSYIDNKISDIDGNKSDVEANPTAEATTTLTKLKVSDTVYSIEGGSSIVYLTQTEYDAMKEAGTLDEDAYYSTDGEDAPYSANNVAYDNSDSGLPANEVQGAIDVLNSNLTNIGKSDILLDRVTTGTHTVENLSQYRFIYISSSFTTQNAFYGSNLVPYEIFKLGYNHIINGTSVSNVYTSDYNSTIQYLSNTQIKVTTFNSNVNIIIYGIK